jgi:hypothetical protein
MIVEEITASVFDTMIRQAGGHSIWMPGSCCRKGFGSTPEGATRRAVRHALNAVPPEFNAAELDSVIVGQYLGFSIANVTVHPRGIMGTNSVEPGQQRRTQAAHAI